MNTLESPPANPPVAQPPDGWPEVVWSDIWVGRRGGNWYAICVAFDVVGKGESAAAALAEMSELADDYIDLCIAEGRSYAESLRPVPLFERVKLHLARLTSFPLRLLERDRRTRETSILLRPHFNGHGC